MIEVHNLTFGYSSKDETNILRGVDFAAQTGKLTAVIGTNGAGKSTLLKTIMGILKGKGDIWVNGKPVAEYTRKEFSSAVSYLSQDNDCRINLSVFEVVMLGAYGGAVISCKGRGYSSNRGGSETSEHAGARITQHHGTERWAAAACIYCTGISKGTQDIAA